jgi:hypothetical protein
MADLSEQLVAKEELVTYFDDLVDAQHWLSMLLIACGSRQRATLDKVRTSCERLARKMITEPPAGTESVPVAAAMGLRGTSRSPAPYCQLLLWRLAFRSAGSPFL